MLYGLICEGTISNNLCADEREISDLQFQVREWRDRCHEMEDELDKIEEDWKDKSKYIERLESENRQLRSEMRAFIANIEEMSIGVGLPSIFIVIKDGQEYAMPPDYAESVYKAIMTKWHKDRGDLISLYENYYTQNVNLRSACQAAGDWLDSFCRAGRCKDDERDEVIRLFDKLSSALEVAS